MAYEEYDYYNEPTTGSLKESLREILNGLQDKTKLREAGTSLKEALQLTPNVTESLGRGGVAQAIGTSGDLRDLSNTINSYLPKSVRNFTKAAEFLANPYSTAIQQFAPTTEETLDFVPRATAPYEGYKQHETMGEYIAPSLGYFGGKAAKAYGNYVGPTAYKAVEDYLTKTGGILNAVEPGEAKKIQEVASAIDELGFHSPLENAILGIKQPKGTGDQFLKQLERTPGVKTEELEVTGLKQYLLDHPTVTKQELLDQMATNRLKLEQKVLSKDNMQDPSDYRLQESGIYHDQDYIDQLANDLEHDMINDPEIYAETQKSFADNFPTMFKGYESDPELATKLDQFVRSKLYEKALKQADEMYYANPQQHYYDEHGFHVYGNDEIGYAVKDHDGETLPLGEIWTLPDARQALMEFHVDQGNIGGEGGVKYEDYTLPGKYTNYREMLTTYEPKRNPPNYEIRELPEGFYDQTKNFGVYEGDKLINTWHGIGNAQDWVKGAKTNYKEYGNFESSHFDEPNILAHTRLNDRIINGKKTLMVEEIQSDWHQTGRKKGYDTPEVRQNIAKERQKLLNQKYYYAKLAEPYAAEGKDSPPDIIEGWTKAANGLQELQKAEDSMAKAVPDAPFKKNWHELMMKQILNEAVKGDYDAVAFTTGKVQAERYNLAKYVETVIYDPELKKLIAWDKNSNRLIDKEVPMDQLEDYIGKEATRKIEEAEPNQRGEKVLNNADLAIGGEGMKGFYDKILPDYINKYGKKYGIKVKQTTLNTSNHNLDNKIIYEDGKYLVDAGDGINYNTFDTKADAIKSLGGNDPEIHYFDVTDMAKKDIKEKGQPLFSGIGLAPAPLLMGDEEDN